MSEQAQREKTETWLREKLPPPWGGWTPDGLHAELHALNGFHRVRDGTVPYDERTRFVNGLLNRLEIEGLVTCETRRQRKNNRLVVLRAYPADRKIK